MISSARIETEADLRKELEILIKKFKTEFLPSYYKLFPRALTDKDISREVDSFCQEQRMGGFDVFENYGALIEWCESKEEKPAGSKEAVFLNEQYENIKSKFLELHTRTLQEFIARREQAQRAALDALGKKYELLKKNNKTMLSQLHNGISEQYTTLENLCHQTDKLLFNLKEDLDDEEFVAGLRLKKYRPPQEFIKELNSRIIRLGITKNSAIQETITRPVGHAKESAHIITDQKFDLLKDLHYAVEKYRDTLSNENILIWLVMIFSPKRWRRRIALSEYDEKVAHRVTTASVVPSSTSVDLWYRNALSWIEKNAQAKEFKDLENRQQSRFYFDCVSRFHRKFTMISFQEIQYFQRKSQEKINEFLQKINEENGAYVLELDTLSQHLHKLVNKWNILQAAINALLEKKEYYSVKNPFGKYSLTEEISDISRARDSAKETLRLYKAELIINQVKVLPRDISEQDLNLLVQEVKQVIQCKDAANIFEDKAIQFIANIGDLLTNKNHALYKDFVRADKVAQVLCYSDDLHKAYIRKKEKVQKLEEKQDQENLLREEKIFVDNLVINPGELIRKLECWIEPFQKHREKSGDEKSEAIYNNIIKLENQQAEKFHASGCKALRDFVQSVIVDLEKIKSYTLKARESRAKGFERMSPKQAALFMIIYAVKEQREEYFKKNENPFQVNPISSLTPIKSVGHLHSHSPLHVHSKSLSSLFNNSDAGLPQITPSHAASTKSLTTQSLATTNNTPTSSRSARFTFSNPSTPKSTSASTSSSSPPSATK